MPTPEIRLPRSLVNRLLHYAQSSPASEICGLIGARDGFPTTCYPVRNTAEQPECRYRLDPEEHLATLRRMQDCGEEIFAVFLSHPAAPAEPSATDLAQSAHPDALHLIISLNTKGVLELRGFRIAEDRRVGEVVLILE